MPGGGVTEGNAVTIVCATGEEKTTSIKFMHNLSDFMCSSRLHIIVEDSEVGKHLSRSPKPEPEPSRIPALVMTPTAAKLLQSLRHMQEGRIKIWLLSVEPLYSRSATSAFLWY